MKWRRERQGAAGWRFGIVVATFNQGVTRRLLAACLDELTSQGVAAEAIEVVRVPGAFELPLVARTLGQSKRFDAVICLGAVIRGETPHFEYISAETSRGIGQAALDTGVPTIFGVLTADTVTQARERADPARFDRGGAAAQAAIEMARVMRRINGGVGKLESQKLTSQTDGARARKRR